MLAKQIEQLNQELSSQLPQEVINAFGKSVDDLKTKILKKDAFSPVRRCLIFYCLMQQVK